MMIKIGEKIRELRKRSDITQERLADYLGISCQAVSRWESGNGYPDLEMLPPIAYFFDISVDELLGVNQTKTNEKMIEYERGCDELWEKGWWKEQEQLLREAIKEFPNNYKFLSRLITVLPYSHENDEEKTAENLKEAIEIGEKILEDCMQDEIRFRTLSSLSHLYMMTGQKDKAVATAKRLPSFSWCSNLVLSSILEGDERRKSLCENVEILTETLSLEIMRILDDNGSNGVALPVSIKIDAAKRVIGLYELIYNDGDFGFYHCRLTWIFRLLAVWDISAGDGEMALKYLEDAVEHAVKFDTLPDKYIHTSFLVDGNIYDKDAYHTLKTHNESWRLLNEYFSYGGFDMIRDEPKFKELTMTLKQYAR